MMQDQLDKSKAETEGILKMKGEIDSLLQGLDKLGLAERQETLEAAGGVPKSGVDDDGKDTWEVLSRDFC